jgi:hypothetical protein
MVKKILMWLLLAMLIFYIFTNPARAGQQANAIGGALIFMANSFSTFVSSIG